MPLTALAQSVIPPILYSVNLPDIQPDFGAPPAQAVWNVVSIVSGIAFGIAVIATIVAIMLVAVKALPSNAREAGASALGWCIFALIMLGSITGLAAWAAGFKIF